jgi:NAD(P)-dependent dehydrogenase (short-subunit alcohol dehydrogenase family)
MGGMSRTSSVLTSASAFDLGDRVAIVTGAGSSTGIGYATAQMLAGMGNIWLSTSGPGRALSMRQESGIDHLVRALQEIVVEALIVVYTRC